MKKVLLTFCVAMLTLVSTGQLVQIVNEVVYTAGDNPAAVQYPAGHNTYRIYAELADGVDRITAVYAVAGQELTLGTANDDLWNSAFGGTIGTDLNAAFFAVFPSAEWDSMVTIGRANSTSPGSSITAVSVIPTATAIQDVFTNPVPGGDLSLTDGTWFTTPDGANSLGQGANFRVLLAQITTAGDIEYELNIQLLDGGVGGTDTKYVWEEADEDVGNDVLYECTLKYPRDCSAGTPGCTDATSCNYNIAATSDDGSCDGGPTGCDVCVGGPDDGTGTIQDNPEVGEACDDGDAGTMNDLIQADCSCAGTPIVNGCTDAGSCNYNAAANMDDGSCDGGATGCDTCVGGPDDGTGSIQDNPEPGEACDDGDAGTMMDTTQADCSCVGVTIVNGCTDAGSCNYNVAANVDDGSCDGGATGCDVCVGGPDDGTGSIQDNPEPGEACDDGDAGTMMDTTQADCSCAGTPIVNGCTDAGSCNYNAAANVDDGSCDGGATGCDVCSGETDGSGTIIDNPEVGEACDDGLPGTIDDTVQADCSCVGIGAVPGCQDAASCNYNVNANTDDGSCDGGATGCDVCSGETDGTGSIIDNPEPGEACDDGDAGTMMDTTQADCSCVGVTIVNGCTDAGSCNYNAAANVDDGSCDGGATGCDVCVGGPDDGTGSIQDNPEPGEACDDGDAGTINDTTQADCSCAGTVGVNGCTDAGSCNYNAAANVDDGSCDGGATGCDTCVGGPDDGTGSIQDNPEPGEACDDGDASTGGDTTQADCSCAGLILGCDDPGACNFDPAAELNDGSCAYPGDSCDDGNASTINDEYQADCSCVGTLVGGGPGIPLALAQYPTCSDVGGAIVGGADVIFEITPPTSGVRVEVLTSDFDATVTILDAADAVVASVNVNGTGDEYINIGSLTAGDTYKVVVSGDVDGSFNICGQWLPDTRADYDEGPYDFCDIYKADWVGADDYRWRFEVDATEEASYEAGGANTLVQLKNVVGLDLNTTYDVLIDAGWNLSLADGSTELVWVMADEVNTLITLPQPTTKMRAADNCANHGPHFLGDYIKATPFVCGSDAWTWRFTPVAGGLPITYVRNSSNRFLRLSWVPGLMPGETYDVECKPEYPTGAATVYGPIECVTIVGTAPVIVDGPVIDETEFVLEREVAEPTAAIYPNPNNGEFMNVNLTGVENSKVTIDIVNTFGSFVQRTELNVANGTVNEIINLNGLASGVYLVNITMDNTVVTERLVIQK